MNLIIKKQKKEFSISTVNRYGGGNGSGSRDGYGNGYGNGSGN
jgi:hypothetical protein